MLLKKVNCFLGQFMESSAGLAIYYGEPFVSKWRYKIPCVGVPKINSICFINSILSTLSGRDRLDVLYQLHFIW